MMGWITVLYMALCVFLIYRNDKKFKAAMEKKKRIEEENRIRRQQEDSNAEYIPPPSKTRGIWPPINNTIYDEEAPAIIIKPITAQVTIRRKSSYKEGQLFQ